MSMRSIHLEGDLAMVDVTDGILTVRQAGGQEMQFAVAEQPKPRAPRTPARTSPGDKGAQPRPTLPPAVAPPGAPIGKPGDGK